MPHDLAPLPGYQAARAGVALFDQSRSTKIELAGPEAGAFLQNLCTQDVKNLPEGGGTEAFLTTAKARVVAHGAVSRVRWQGEDVFWFDTEPNQAERVLGHLNHFLISEQLELRNRTADVGMLRLVGPATASLLKKVLDVNVDALAPWRSVAVNVDDKELIVRRFAGLALPTYDCFCTDQMTPVLTHRVLAAGAELGQASTQELLRIEAGWPEYGKDIDENRFVVEVGRTAQAICYTKGCFLGQEPIVMARDRGQVNRMLLGVLCGDGPLLASGAKLFQRDAEVGQVTSSVMSPGVGQVIALAYIKRGSQAPGTALTTDPSPGARKVIVHELPFVDRPDLSITALPH